MAVAMARPSTGFGASELTVLSLGSCIEHPSYYTLKSVTDRALLEWERVSSEHCCWDTECCLPGSFHKPPCFAGGRVYSHPSTPTRVPLPGRAKWCQVSSSPNQNPTRKCSADLLIVSFCHVLLHWTIHGVFRATTPLGHWRVDAGVASSTLAGGVEEDWFAFCLSITCTFFAWGIGNM